MRFFPVFLRVADQRIVVSGGGRGRGGEAPASPEDRGADRGLCHRDRPGHPATGRRSGRLTVIRRPVGAVDVARARLVYGANDEAVEDARVAKLAENAGVLHNIVDNLEGSAFLTPAMVDRDPVVVAIGTEGAAPVLARKVKAHLEEKLPAALGALVKAAEAFRPQAEALPKGRARRAFWSAVFADAFVPGAAPEAGALDRLLAQHLGEAPKKGRVLFVGAGPGDPDDPDDAGAARARPGGRGDPRPAGAEGDPRTRPARGGDRGGGQDRLRRVDAAGRDQRDDRGPGAEGRGRGAAQGGRSGRVRAARRGDRRLRRGRDRMDHRAGADLGLDGGGAAGPEPDEARAEHGSAVPHGSWRGRRGGPGLGLLARPGSVAAIYMGKRAARFIQGRLLMHGADPATPGRRSWRTRAGRRSASSPTHLAVLEPTLTAAGFDGPAIIFIGLAPRGAAVAEVRQEAVS